ncbi:MAG TPA: hypothetical protein VGD79_01045 [Thermoanaerobaculia bacterium]|jgi:hypothetical protein
MQSISSRYSDAYGFTRFLNNVGAAVQYAGLSLGSLIWLGSAASMTILPVPIAERLGNEAALIVPVFAVMGVGIGTVIGVALYVFGVLIAAHGQILTATLDTAVNSSHVLSDDDRARILSMPVSSAAAVPPMLLPSMPGAAAAQSH